MDDRASDYDDFSDDEGTILDINTELQHIGKSTLKYLNYTTSYVRTWGLDEAFRESYQNWCVGLFRISSIFSNFL
jgi:hypothetical protein